MRSKAVTHASRGSALERWLNQKRNPLRVPSRRFRGTEGGTDMALWLAKDGGHGAALGLGLGLGLGPAAPATCLGLLGVEVAQPYTQAK